MPDARLITMPAFVVAWVLDGYNSIRAYTVHSTKGAAEAHIENAPRALASLCPQTGWNNPRAKQVDVAFASDCARFMFSVGIRTKPYVEASEPGTLFHEIEALYINPDAQDVMLTINSRENLSVVKKFNRTFAVSL